MAKSAASWVNDLWRMTAASARLFGSTIREVLLPFSLGPTTP
jgi:hypothetical protein